MLQLISSFLGWVYVAAWSLSFYPQIILNHRLKSVDGLSLDFLLANALGFFCYGIFNVLLYTQDNLRADFVKGYSKDILVSITDVAFSVHALSVTIATLAQYFWLKGKFKVSVLAKVLLAVSLCGIVAFAILTLIMQWSWVHLLYFMSLIKIATSFIKYIPQVYLNHSRRSTVGWSIVNIFLDLCGGIMSEIQLFLDAYISQDFSAIWGHPVKLGLGVTSLIFDLIFIYQHFSYGRTKRFDNITDENDSDGASEYFIIEKQE